MKRTAEKVMPIPGEQAVRKLGTDDLHICEFPLCSTGRATKKDETTLVFEDDIYDEGAKQPVHRQLIIASSKTYGLPTPADSDVFLVLLHLTDLKNKFQERTVPFTRYELVKALGWNQSGKSYRRIEESLRRWVNVTLNYHRAWWDRECRRWQSKSFHVLETIDLRGRGEHLDDGRSTFTWNEVIFNSVQSNQVKRLDLDTYFQLSSPAAKQAYRFLDKRFYRSKRLEFDLRCFACEHVGFSRNYDNGQLKRKLHPAIEELERIHFLQPLSFAERYRKRLRGEWTIQLLRADQSPIPSVISAPSPLVNELTKRGVTASVAQALVRRFDERVICEKIAHLDWLLQQSPSRHPKNPAGFLTQSIRDNYSPPVQIIMKQTEEQAPVRPPRGTQRIALPADPRSAIYEQVRLHMASLDPQEQACLETLAIAQGNRFKVESYRRLLATGGKGGEELRNDLIADYLLNQKTL